MLPIHTAIGEIRNSQDSFFEVDPNRADSTGKTPLHYAAISNNSELIQKLIKDGAKLDAVDSLGFTPLHYAALLHAPSDLYPLVKEGANLHALDLTGQLTPLLFISMKKTPDAAAFLNQAGRKAEECNPRSYTPLHIVAQIGSLSMTKTLLSSSQDLESREVHGMTPLHLAAVFDHEDVLDLLIDSGANVNALTLQSHHALHIASGNGSTQAVKRLIWESIEYLNAVGDDGLTPLGFAAEYQQMEIAELLIKHGADTGVLKEEQKTWLGGNAQIEFWKRQYPEVLNLRQKFRLFVY